jgi:diphosphomevalonate decarboxylase
MGGDDEDSYAVSIAGSDHWPLADCIALVREAHKKTGSTEGHALAGTSPLQAARLADTPHRLELCRRAILDRDFEALTTVVELDSDMMHAVMMTSSPALHYWMPASLEVMNAVRSWRAEKVPACFTVDAGANVHVLCPQEQASDISGRLKKIAGVKDVLVAGVGGPAELIEEI